MSLIVSRSTTGDILVQAPNGGLYSQQQIEQAIAKFENEEERTRPLDLPGIDALLQEGYEDLFPGFRFLTLDGQALRRVDGFDRYEAVLQRYDYARMGIDGQAIHQARHDKRGFIRTLNAEAHGLAIELATHLEEEASRIRQAVSHL